MVLIISVVMYFTGFSASVISGTGGIISSSLWIYYLWKTGALGGKSGCKECGSSRSIEFLVAVVWLIFSMYVILATPYDAPSAQSMVTF